jgi:hypothetical protein
MTNLPDVVDEHEAAGAELQLPRFLISPLL